MLVLARQLHERIVIPLISTSVEVVSARTNMVRLGIDAPPEITVLREELSRQQPVEEAPSSVPVGGEKAVQERLHTLFLDLSRLQQKTRAQKQNDLTVCLLQMVREVVLLSQQMDALLQTSEETLDRGLAT